MSLARGVRGTHCARLQDPYAVKRELHACGDAAYPVESVRQHEGLETNKLCEGKVTTCRVNFSQRPALSMLTKGNPITILLIPKIGQIT